MMTSVRVPQRPRTHRVPYRPAPDAPAQRAGAPTSPACNLWMIDHYGSTVLPCRCLESSTGRMRLRVPLGYGVAEGQRYELCLHPQGAGLRVLAGLAERHWATVVETRLDFDELDGHLAVTVALDPDTVASLPALGGAVA